MGEGLTDFSKILEYTNYLHDSLPYTDKFPSSGIETGKTVAKPSLLSSRTLRLCGSLTQLETLGEAWLDFTAIEDLLNWLTANQTA